MSRRFAPLVAALLLSCSTAQAEPIGILEKYALATDRPAVLRELIPGSEEYFQLHCLHYQVTGQLDQAEAMLTRWDQWRGNQPESPALSAMRDRQRLLTYATSPDRTVEHLRNRLNVRLDHPAPRRAGQRQWPDRLDPSLLERRTVIEQSLRSSQQLTPAALAQTIDWMLEGEINDWPVNLEWLSQQISGRWSSRLGELALRELQARPPQSRAFGDRAVHNFLTLEELQEIARAIPEVSDSDALIHRILQRLRPNEDQDPGQQPEVRLAYLQRVEQFTRDLPVSQNNLKAASAYRLLEAYWMRGEYPRPLFERYLALPRQSQIAIPRPTIRAGAAANLNQDFTELALLPPVGNEEPLVRAYLEHFLSDAESPEAFQGLVERDYLARVFAETKLLDGVGDPERWYPMLTSTQRAELTDRVEVTLAPTNPTYSDTDQPAELLLDLKHVDQLIVRIYEINSDAYYRSHTKPINTDLDLDGLVATSEQRIDYSQPAIRRHRETIEIPEISGRGIWIVDLLGGGKRARAILRRGDLRHTERMTADGQSFVILDENRQPVPQARMLVAGQEWLADDQGRVVLPPVDQAVTRRAVLMDDEIAVPLLFLHQAESYQLNAQFAIHRQQLREGQTAELIVRPRLQLAGEPVAPSILRDVVLTVTATDQEGIETSKRFEDLDLQQTSEAVVQFRVPRRLRQLSATLSGRLDMISTGRETEVRDQHAWDINGVDDTNLTYDLYLTRDGDDWMGEVRGRSGERMPGQTISLTLMTYFSNRPISTTLETDDSGRVRLGPLPGVESVRMQSANGASLDRNLDLDSTTWPSRLHGRSDQPIRLAAPAGLENNARSLQLLAMRGGLVAADLSESGLKIEDGLLTIGPLDPGNYELVRIEAGQALVTQVAITDGPATTGIAAGKIRHLELRWPEPVGMQSITLKDAGLDIQLAGDTSLARVHVFGSRFLNDRDPLALPLVDPSLRGIDLAENGYVSDLKLGDEYLYVLRRQFAKKYPGVMLPQPSLLVAPWVTDSTENAEQEAAPGEAVPESNMAAPRPQAQRGSAVAADDSRRRSTTADLNFLPDEGLVLTNLKPDENGRIQVPSDALGSSQIFRVVVADPLQSIERTVARAETPVDPLDLRLANALPAEKPLAFERGVLIASPESPLEMSRIGTAQVQLYTTVAELLQLMRTLSGDARLDQFIDLGRWHTLDEAAKRAAYGRLACHEMHVFLKAKDPSFFDAVVRPYLENKKEKQLVDQWLLDRDLQPWTDLWRYESLNAFEKALLAREVPEIRSTVEREFREQLARIDVPAEQLRRLVEAGLAGKGLAFDDAGNAEFGYFFDNELGEEVRAMSRQNRAEGEALGLRLQMLKQKSATATLSDADGVDRFDSARAGAEPAPPMPAVGMGGFGGGGGARRMAMGRSAGPARRFFQQLDATKEWAENHWDQVRVREANASLIPLDPFWQDWAQHESGAFISEHLLRPSANRHAALIALALLDLPLERPAVELPTDPDGVFTPDQPVAVITKRLQSLEPLGDDPSLLVGQRFEAVNATVDPNAEEVRIAPVEFLTGVAYRGQIVVTNPTPQQRTVDCLWQIPAGSLPLAGSQATDSKTVEINPFEVHRIEYVFYFPGAGEFQHYPVCLSSKGTTEARGDERTFNVVGSPTQIDETSWDQIAQTGSAEQIATFLESANLRQLNLELVAHRMRDRAIYDAVIDLLDRENVWNQDLWGYAFNYRDQPRMRTFLEQRGDFVAAVGPVLDSSLLEVHPIDRKLYEHLEYAPLVRARIHPLRSESEILNDRFLVQYRALMQIIAYQPQPTPVQDLALCYYLLLQNRIEEALDRFAGLDRGGVQTQLQYDYLATYLALHRGDYQTAADTAAEHLDHPVPRWRERFADVHRQIRQRRDLVSGSQLVNAPDGEADGDDQAVREDAADLALMDRQRRQADEAASTPDVRVRVEGDSLVIDHRNTEQVQLRFYGVDLELLFSKTPFVQQGLEEMAIVQPSRTELISVDASTGSSRYRLDDQLSRQTLLIEVVAGAARDTALYYGGRLKTYVSEGFGQLQTSDRSSGDPVSTAYVKVYVQKNDGSVEFYKDGYTDLRGRFDYATLSTGDLSQVRKLAILVMDTERGATLHEVAPPTR